MAGKFTDWTLVAQEFNAGEKPVKEIAEKYGLAAITIYAKAKREGWTRPAQVDSGAGGASVQPRAAPMPLKRVAKKGTVNAARALARMMAIVNRLADELEQHLDSPDDSVKSAAEKKGAADILTSLARALEKLTVLEREARIKDGGNDVTENSAGTNGGWDEIQRRLARLSAGTETP